MASTVPVAVRGHNALRAPLVAVRHLDCGSAPLAPKIPLKDRLILFAYIDGADERLIRQCIKVSKEDSSLSRQHMERIAQRLKCHLSQPHQHFPEVWTRADLTPDHDLSSGVVFADSNGVAWNRRYGADLENHLGRLLRSDVAVALIGQCVPREIASLNVKHRLMEGITQEETIQIMGCTEWEIERSQRDGLRAVGGQ